MGRVIIGGQNRYFNDKDIDYSKGTVKTHAVKPIDEKITFESKPAEYEAPQNVTVNEFGDFQKSKNAKTHKITSIKQPKKRCAKNVRKIDNAINSVMSEGYLWANAEKQTVTKTQQSNNKRKNKRS